MYGKFEGLARRLLNSFRHPAFLRSVNFRIGLNNVGWPTSSSVRQWITDIGAMSTAEGFDRPSIYTTYGAAPYYKYPLMRRMIHTNDVPKIDTPYVMWFDDDSCLSPAGTADWIVADWIVRLVNAMSRYDMVGGKYSIRLRGNQHRFIEDQPWYNGKKVLRNQRVNFITGGWWVIRTELLYKYDWPPENFEHNGGDVMLGELLRQHGYSMGQWTEGVSINADHSGGISTAKRRGITQIPIGVRHPIAAKPAIPNLFDILDGKYDPNTHS